MRGFFVRKISKQLIIHVVIFKCTFPSLFFRFVFNNTYCLSANNDFLSVTNYQFVHKVEFSILKINFVVVFTLFWVLSVTTYQFVRKSCISFPYYDSPINEFAIIPANIINPYICHHFTKNGVGL